MRAAALALFVTLFIGFNTSPARAESKSLQWLRLDSDIAVQPNGGFG